MVLYSVRTTFLALSFLSLCTVGAAAQEPAKRCETSGWSQAPQRLPPLLGKVARTVRGEQHIVDFQWAELFPEAREVGVGGITSNRGQVRLAAPSEPQAAEPVRDQESKLDFNLLRAADGQYTWGIHVQDSADATKSADLTPAAAPAGSALSGVLREGDRVYMSLQFNTYAKTMKGKGCRVVALDVCEQRLVWSSKDLVSNAPMVIIGDYLVTGYGFTAEPDFLYVLNKWKGAVVQKIKLPKGPDELRMDAQNFYVRIYDGVLVFPLVQNTRAQIAK